jgi:hypothetical protein
MSTQSPRKSKFVPPARRRRPAEPVRLRCERFEDRITPALFTVHTPYSFSGQNNNGSVAVADLNHDGFADAVMTNEGTDFGGGAASTITVLYGRAAGGFTKIQLNTGGTNVSFVAIADINGDGWADVVAVNENNHNGGTVSVFMNDGAGNLSLVGTPFSSFSRNPSWVGVADVTGDGVPDIIVGSFGTDDGTGNNITGNNVTIFQGNADTQGHGNFTYSSGPITTLAPDVSFIPTALAVADFNGDGIMDIAAAVPGVPADSTQPQPDGSVYIFQGTGSGGFAAPNILDSGGALPVNIQAADLNGDGKKDLIVANAGDPNGTPEFTNNSVGVLLNVSSATNVNFGIPNILTANCYGTFAVAVADFNMDGKMDIAAVNYGAQSSLTPPAFVSIYLGNGLGTFTPGTPGTYDTDPNPQTALPGGQYLAVGDFDHNGTPDLIVAQASDLVGLLLNTSAPPPPVKVSAVTVNDATAQRSEVRSITVTFTGPVTFTGSAAAAFQLTHLTDSNNVALGAAVSTNGLGQTVVTLTFSGAETDSVSGQNGGQLSLADGRYSLTILSANVTGNGVALDGDGNGTAGGDYVSPTDTLGGGTGQLHLYRLFGDVTGDGIVDQQDLGQFRTSFNSGTPNLAFDANNDHNVDQQDLGQFRTRFNTNVFPAGPIVAPPPPTVASTVVNDGNAQRSEVRSVTVTFSGPVAFSGGNANAAAAFQLKHLTDGNNVDLTAAVSADSQGRTVVVLTFAGAETDPLSARNGGVASLADGRYALTIFSGSVVGTNGAALAGGGPNGNYVSPTDTLGGGAGQLHLFRLFGDVNGDGVIDQIDLGAFRKMMNASVGDPFYLSFLDADNSGTVDQVDLGQFRSRFNANVF